MNVSSKKPFLGLAGILCLHCCLLGCQNSAPAPKDPPPPTMTVAPPVKKKIVEWDAYTGRLEAVEFVEIRSRVSGYLESIHFEEGQIAQKGALLFVIDPRPFHAELNGAKAALSQAVSMVEQAKAKLNEAKAKGLQSDAQLQLAEARVQRARLLKASNASTQEELDQREAELLQAKADVEASKAEASSAEAAIASAKAAIDSAKASVVTAELNLDYTQVRAPVTGRVSREYVTEGNLISGGSASSTLLTTIASVDPIYCTFDANEQQVLKYIRLAQAGRRQSSRDAKNPVYLGLIDEDGFPHVGHMDFVDNRFDSSTASMRARCVFSNDDQVLLPGMFARIRIPGSAGYEAILIPDSSVGTDQASQFVYVVVDGVIERRAVKLGPIVDGLRVVREGLEGGESLVIEGMIRARPELKVNTQAGEIQIIEDGLPDDYEPLPREKWISPEQNSTQNPSSPPKPDSATPTTDAEEGENKS